jgi:hypothetical protein
LTAAPEAPPSLKTPVAFFIFNRGFDHGFGRLRLSEAARRAAGGVLRYFRNG